MNNRIILFLLMVTCFASCINSKKTTYFQALESKVDLDSMTIKCKFNVLIQSGDILSLRVSSLSPEANSMFNIFPETVIQSQTQTIQSTAPSAAIGFLVDEDDEITLPIAGKIKVGGLKTKEAADLITKNLDKYLVQPTVNVRIINFKISILGEVAKPSVYTVSNEKITLPEALSLAGDLTIYGKRNNILIIREVNGIREFARVDLTQRNLFNSPYYFLQPNDIIYVEPVKGKLTTTSRSVQLLPIVLSSLSFVAILTSYWLK